LCPTIPAFDTPRYISHLVLSSCARAFLFGRSTFQSKLFFSALPLRNCDLSSKFASTFLFRLFIFLRFTFLVSCTCVGNAYPKSSLRLVRHDGIARCHRMYSHFGSGRHFQRLHFDDRAPRSSSSGAILSVRDSTISLDIKRHSSSS